MSAITKAGGVAVFVFALGANAAIASDTTYVDPCIDAVIEANGPDVAPGGGVISQSYSEAGTLVMLEDSTGAVWRCISYKDGSVGELTKVEDGGAGSASSSEPSTDTETVKFKSGETGAELTGSLTPGSSHRYELGAKDGQFLYVRVAPNDATIDYQIFNPDGSALLDMTPTDREYRGQLFQNGTHVVEVINRSSQSVSFNVIFGIE
ncbi:hypothetical protein [Primorskyibacter sp. S87]|uniref:hypothetical protein n=1 Tax=Primorskyibacter sp. S87 TaxID=3415126 RepID=UPI003C7CCE9E